MAHHLFHPDSVSTFSLQYIVHHNQVFTSYFPLLAGKVDHSKESSVLTCCNHLVHLLYHFCWQTAGKESVEKNAATCEELFKTNSATLLSHQNSYLLGIFKQGSTATLFPMVCEPPFCKPNDLFVF